MKEPKEWFVAYYNEYAKIIETDMLDMDEPDVLMEVFLRLESNPDIVKVIVYTTKKDGGPGVPFAAINKVIA